MCINGKLPEYFLNTWLKRCDLNPRNLRNSKSLSIKISNKENFTSNIGKTKFCKNLKELLLRGLNWVCNNPILA